MIEQSDDDRLERAGTGEGNNGCDNEFGQGVLKSTNGGASWTQQRLYQPCDR